MRLVLDTNVVVSALLWKGAPRELFDCCDGENIVLFSSPPLLAELNEILSRSKFQSRIAASRLSIVQIVQLYAELSIAVRPRPTSRLAPDPDDDVVIGTALAARADFIVTGDRTLLAVAEYEGGRIISVTEALEAVPQSRAL